VAVLFLFQTVGTPGWEWKKPECLHSQAFDILLYKFHFEPQETQNTSVGN
jgi:hypothetical protein